MSASTINTPKDRKINPQKFALWLAIASIIMMFGGFTSGYIVRRSQGMWEVIDLPIIFVVSTAAILLSSVTMYVAVKQYRKSNFSSFRRMLILSLLLGLSFSIMQLYGFSQMYDSNIKIDGNPAGSFLYIIAGIHILHILGGIVAIVYQLIRARKNVFTQKRLEGLETMSTYWHFVDLLWIYLYVFFIFFR
jgi:cytochrome c oxidase subunit 3